MLLDNHKAVLPFDKSIIKSVAVIGPNADNPGNMQVGSAALGVPAVDESCMVPSPPEACRLWAGHAWCRCRRRGCGCGLRGPACVRTHAWQGVDCHGVPPFLITPTQGIGNFSAVNFAPGCAIGGTDQAGFAAAVAAVKASDAVVLVLGCGCPVILPRCTQWFFLYGGCGEGMSCAWTSHTGGLGGQAHALARPGVGAPRSSG